MQQWLVTYLMLRLFSCNEFVWMQFIHLWLNFITFMVSQIITVKVDFYYIHGWYYTYGLNESMELGRK